MKNFFHPSNLLLSFFSIVVNISFGQDVPPGAFKDIVYSQVEKNTDIIYGSNYNWQTNREDTLKLDTYEPVASVNYLRPVLIYVHGTGSDKCCDKAVDFGNYFAQRGYVVASINYREGVENPFTTADNYEEGYEATQDAKASIRFFRRYASDYCADTSSIFMVGSSAGALITLACAFWDQNEINPFVDEQKLGPLDQGSGNPGYSSDLRVIISCWGGIDDTSWMSNNNMPHYLFHGTNDTVVPYKSGYGPSGIFLYGSYDIHQAAIRYGIESHLHPFNGFGHGVPEGSPEMDTVLELSDTFLYSHLPNNIGRAACLTAVPPSPSNQPFNIVVSPDISGGSFDATNNSSNDAFEGIMSLFDLNGKMIYSGKIFLPPGSSKHFAFDDLATGIYLLHFTGDKNEVVKKIMIEK